LCSGESRLITIRTLQREDRGALVALVRDTGVFSEEEIEVAQELIDAVLNDPEQDNYLIYSAVDEEQKVLGYYCVGPTPMTEATYDLYWIAVKPSVHNRGVGKQLITHAEELVALRGGRLIVAETSSKPSYEGTRMFYLRARYQELARIRDYYRTGDDLVVYGKYLSQ
jgi:ribosomal protein S18 acetylase RimI-like enzyme